MTAADEDDEPPAAIAEAIAVVEDDDDGESESDAPPEDWVKMGDLRDAAPERLVHSALGYVSGEGEGAIDHEAGESDDSADDMPLGEAATLSSSSPSGKFVPRLPHEWEALGGRRRGPRLRVARSRSPHRRRSSRHLRRRPWSRHPPQPPSMGASRHRHHRQRHMPPLLLPHRP